MLRRYRLIRPLWLPEPKFCTFVTLARQSLQGVRPGGRRIGRIAVVAGGNDIAFVGMARQAEMVRNGEVSPTELVGSTLERIDRLDPALDSLPKGLAAK